MPEIPRLRENNVRQGFFDTAQFKAVCEHLPDYLRGFCRFAYRSGWRKSEISSLQWTDVDMLGRVIRLRPENAKNGQGRALVLEGELWNVIEAAWKTREFQRPDGTVGLSLDVFHRDGRPIASFRKSWASACKAANVEGRLFHDLRRSAVRNMVRSGVPERVAMSISGHKTRAIFDRYNIVSEDDLRQAVQKTEAYLNSTPSSPAVVSIQEMK